MLVASEGVFLHQIRHSDQQNIIRVYTRQFGMISLLVPAVKRKTASRVFFQHLLPVEIHFQLRENRSLCRMHEIRLLHAVQNIHASPVKTAQMLFLSEVILKSVREEERNQGLFDFILNSILLLDQHQGDLPDFHLKFILDLTRFLGFYPANNFDEHACWFSISEGAFVENQGDLCLEISLSQILSDVLRTPYEHISTLKLNGNTRRVLLRAILQYYQWHLSTVKDLKTPDVLEEVFS
jgi:DNA repair protein RecO (recombination protein O)